MTSEPAIRKHLSRACLLLSALVLTMGLANVWIATHNSQPARSRALVRQEVEWVLVSGTDSVTIAHTTSLREACWVYEGGPLRWRNGLLRLAPSASDSLAYHPPGEAVQLMEMAKSRHESRQERLEKQKSELAYYLRVHSVQDEGFEMAAAYDRRLDTLLAAEHELGLRLQHLTDGQPPRLVRLAHHSVFWHDMQMRLYSLHCRETRKPLFVRTLDGKTPQNAIVRSKSESMELANRRHEGCAQVVSNLLLSAHTPLLPAPAKLGKRFLPTETMAMFVDYKGRAALGTWRDGQLTAMIRRANGYEYDGEAEPGGMAGGHGTLTGPDENYFEGHFKHGMRSGNGFSALPDGRVRTGEWSENVFKGERMRHHSDRIYGIDVSRYQHEQGRNTYAIAWDKLRITDLGVMTKKEVEGEVDYPVSFAYIKSTEGKTVVNKYFMRDYNRAKANGIAVGAYHFFSTKTPAREQAAHFLKNTPLQAGDLPPVLDVEPSEWAIKSMGGSEKMFNEIRVWLTMVEAACGVKPVLYINQQFVNRHLSEAPDVKRTYRVWIARYGEYKPDVHLLMWQLSPDGHVEGIKGDVDINVFNGFGEQFDEFLKKNCIFAPK